MDISGVTGFHSSSTYTSISEMFEVERAVGVMVENTFIHIPVPKDCSETSDVLQSAPGGSGKEPINPRRWASRAK